jgi:hypothetical protein
MTIIIYGMIMMLGLIGVLYFKVIQLEKQVNNIDEDVEQLFNESQEQFVLNFDKEE